MEINKLRKELHCKVFEYDTNTFNFLAILENVYGVELEQLHQYLGSFNQFERKNDQSTLAHKVFYSAFNKEVKLLYEKFIFEVIRPIINEKFYFQKIPTFRIGLPGNKFVGEFHKDSYYNHQFYEINFNVGLCNYTGEASLKTELSPDSGDYSLLECPYGKIFSFDHIDCLHGSEPNSSDKTMVSFDFRIALASLYRNVPSAKSVNMKSSFTPGSYFSENQV